MVLVPFSMLANIVSFPCQLDDLASGNQKRPLMNWPISTWSRSQVITGAALSTANNVSSGWQLDDACLTPAKNRKIKILGGRSIL